MRVVIQPASQMEAETFAIENQEKEANDEASHVSGSRGFWWLTIAIRIDGKVFYHGKGRSPAVIV